MCIQIIHYSSLAFCQMNPRKIIRTHVFSNMDNSVQYKRNSKRWTKRRLAAKKALAASLCLEVSNLSPYATCCTVTTLIGILITVFDKSKEEPTHLVNKTYIALTPLVNDNVVLYYTTTCLVNLRILEKYDSNFPHFIISESENIIA